ncbi:MAG: hypothetical protein ACI8PZ_002271, partial [Myxococcota bacterium]
MSVRPTMRLIGCAAVLVGCAPRPPSAVQHHYTATWDASAPQPNAAKGYRTGDTLGEVLGADPPVAVLPPPSCASPEACATLTTAVRESLDAQGWTVVELSDDPIIPALVRAADAGAEVLFTVGTLDTEDAKTAGPPTFGSERDGVYSPLTLKRPEAVFERCASVAPPASA